MKILSRNVREPGRKCFKFQLKEVINYCSSDIGLLLENKFIQEKLEIVKNFKNPNLTPPEGLSGGIWLLWRSSTEFSLDIVSTNNRYIHGLIQNNIRHSSWLGTFVYGYPHQHLQKQYGNKYLICLIRWINLD